MIKYDTKTHWTKSKLFKKTQTQTMNEGKKTRTRIKQNKTKKMKIEKNTKKKPNYLKNSNQLST